jgi:hypothetical protein
METSSIQIHHGSWDAATRTNEALRFLEKYVAMVDSRNLSKPYLEWFTPDAAFQDADGTIYEGGAAVWDFMGKLFGVADTVTHDILKVKVENDDNGSMVTLETITNFMIKNVAEPHLAIPRLLEFSIGKSVADSQGTDGLQIYKLRVWWDKSSLSKKIADAKAER